MNVALDCKAPGSKVPSPLDTKDVWTNNNIPCQVAVYTYSNLYNSYALLQYCHLMHSKLFQRKIYLFRSHYRKVVLKKTLGAWKDEWWQARREWTLNIRAGCHYM